MSRKKSGTWRVQGGNKKGGFVSKGDDLYISLYCRGTVSGEHSKWLIGSLRAQEVDDRIAWFESESGYAQTDSDQLIKVFPPFTRWLDGDVYVPREDADPLVFNSPTFRVVWDFVCPKCNFSYRIRKPETVYSTVEAIVKVGVEEIGIREFRERVIRSA